ncbi:proline dehydrogenase family protein [Streptomyces capparidis]
MFRRAVLAASRTAPPRRLVRSGPVARALVSRYVAGDGPDEALAVAARLAARGLTVSLDLLGEGTTDPAAARRVRDAYTALLARLADQGLADTAEVSVKLSAVGAALPRDGDRVAREHAHAVCAAARAAGTTVTLDMEDHTTTDATLATARELRRDFPWLGVAVQAYLRRTEADCRDLAAAGARVRLCKGAYDEPRSVAHRGRREVDLAYVRCLGILMSGGGYPMVATHDPRLVELARVLAVRAGRAPGRYELQMLYGVRPDEQLRLASAGERVRVYVPYGDQWYGYFVRRLAERPANMAFFLRSVASKG